MSTRHNDGAEFHVDFRKLSHASLRLPRRNVSHTVDFAYQYPLSMKRISSRPHCHYEQSEAISTAQLMEIASLRSQ